MSGPSKCDPTCPGWAVFNETEYFLGVIQRCDECASMAAEPMFDEDAWEKARASGLNVDTEGNVIAPKEGS